MSESPLQIALGHLSQFVIAESDLEGTLNKIARLAIEAIPGAAFVGYSLLDHEGNPSTPVYTDEKSPLIDQAQYDEDRGPCLDAGRTGAVVRLDDLDQAIDKYPAFCRKAESYGIFSTLSLPLLVAGKGTGAMNLYGQSANAFSAEDEVVGVSLTKAISVVIANAIAYSKAQSATEHLIEAMKSRAMIEQAKGILMAQRRGISADDAFDMLKTASQNSNSKLRDIAQTIVDRSTAVPPK